MSGDFACVIGPEALIMQAKSLLNPLVIGCSEAEPDGQGIERVPLIPALIRRSVAEPDQRPASLAANMQSNDVGISN